MKYIIFLASNDTDARSNYARLVNYRKDSALDNEKPLYDILNYDSTNNILETPKPTVDAFLKSNHGAHKINLEIEFVAHGHPYLYKRLLILPKGKDIREPMVEISPNIIAKFFNQYVRNLSGYSFSNLTLYCCSSVPFGRELSELMPGMNITCFNDDIFIGSNGIVYAKGGAEQSKARIFSSGIEKIIRGNPYSHIRSKSLDSSLPQKKASTDKTDSHESAPATPRKR
jgi:hypothetical protein